MSDFEVQHQFPAATWFDSVRFLEGFLAGLTEEQARKAIVQIDPTGARRLVIDGQAVAQVAEMTTEQRRHASSETVVVNGEVIPWR